MQQYTCDWCGRQRRDREHWIVALAAEQVGATACRREISIAGHWSEELARHPFAVHFCSEDHKRRYVERLLLHQDEIAVTTRSISARSATVTRPTRAISAPARVRSQAPGPRPAARRKARPRFNRADRLRARGLGVQI